MAWIDRFRHRKSWVMAVDKPEDLNRFKGRMVRVTDDNHKERVVEIERVVGSFAERHPTKFQVDSNGESFLISMLDFYAQMNGEEVSPEEIKLFDETTFEVRNGLRPNQRRLWTPN